jgi:VanZ family protein
MMTKQRCWWTGPAWAWAFLIIAITSYPKLETPDIGFDAQDKLYHFIIYFVFGVLLMRAFTQARYDSLIPALKKSAMIGVVFAVFDELHQLLIPGRQGDVLDAIADICGILGSIFLFFMLYKRFFENIQSYSVAGRPLL